MRLIVSLGLILLFTQAKAQIISKVNFDEIKELTLDSTSKFYYPDLKKRMVDKDTSFSAREYHMLYYGQVFEEKYHPYGTDNAKKDFLDHYKKQEYKKAFKKGEQALKENPVDLELLLKMSIVCLKEKKENEKRHYAKYYYSFLDVIYYSGDGKDVSSALVVTTVDHEYYIAGDLGLRVVHQQLISDCDLLSFSKKDQPKIKGRKKIKELYFNVRMPLMSLSNAFKDADLPDPEDDEE